METPSSFHTFNQFLGPFGIPLYILAALVIALLAVKIYHFFIQGRPVKKGLDAILFWGCIAAALGLIGQLSEIWALLNSIQKAADISPQLILIGFLSSFVPALFGLVTGLFSALAWWVMRYRLAELQKNSGQQPGDL